MSLFTGKVVSNRLIWMAVLVMMINVFIDWLLVSIHDVYLPNGLAKDDRYISRHLLIISLC